MHHVWDDSNGTWKRVTELSPLLGIKTIDDAGLPFLEKYLDQLMAEGLPNIEEKMYSAFERDLFKSRMLVHLGQLTAGSSTSKSVSSQAHTHSSTAYSEQDNKVLAEDVGRALRMVVCTFIMNYTLDIAREGRDDVLKQLSGNQDPKDYPEETSPWMMSMQLKHYFSTIRFNLIRQNLERLQKIMQSSKKLERTSAFVIMLAFAMVLEECQDCLVKQAEGRVFRREATYEASYANLGSETFAIDHEFAYLRQTLLMKYETEPGTQNASLRDWVDTTTNTLEKDFLRNVVQDSDKHRKCQHPFPSDWCPI